jgi:hypothetical protein
MDKSRLLAMANLLLSYFQFYVLHPTYQQWDREAMRELSARLSGSCSATADI